MKILMAQAYTVVVVEGGGYTDVLDVYGMCPSDFAILDNGSIV